TPRMRGTAIAVTYALINVAGFGLGPWLVGVISDALNRPDSLRFAFALLSLLFLWAAVHFLLAAQTIASERAEAQCNPTDVGGADCLNGSEAPVGASS